MAAIKQSAWAKFQDMVRRPQSAGAVHTTDFSYDASAGLLAVDKVDLGILMAGAKVVDAIVWSDADVGGATNATVGIMSGDVGSTDPARTLGTEILNAVAITNAHTAVVRPTNPAMMKLAASNVDRSVGLQVSADIAAGAGKTLHVRLFYVQ